MLALLYFGTRGGQAGHGFCRRAPWKLWRLAFLASELGLGAPHCKTCVRLLRRASRARCVPMGLARASQAYSGSTSRAQPCRRRKPGLRFAPAALCAHLRLFARLTHAVKRALRAPVLGDKCIFLLPHVAGHALPRLHHRPVTLETFFAYSCRVHAFPSPERVSRRRLLLFALGTLPFFAILGPQCRPIHSVSSPEAKQQVSPQLRSSLERRRVEGAPRQKERRKVYTVITKGASRFPRKGWWN